MNNIENQICEAVELIVDKKLESAKFDKTIQATILSCEDENTGKYRCKYQDAVIFAYSSSDKKYQKGSLVYITVPQGDMTNNKVILGTTKDMSADYISIVEEKDKYYRVGGDCIDSKEAFLLSSYKPETKVLINTGFNENSVDYLSKCNYIEFSAIVDTSLPAEQRMAGNYGVIFTLEFNNNVTKQYVLDANSMIGNPYELSKSEQKVYFAIDGENFVRIVDVKAFVSGFPKTNSSKPKDISISNLSIYGVERIPEEELNSATVKLLTPLGTYFNDKNRLTIKAKFLVKGVETASSVSYYWFRENPMIAEGGLAYHQLGGRGWECLNTYNEINDSLREYLPSTDSVYVVNKTDIISKSQKYKVVAVYRENSYSSVVELHNNAGEYSIEIQSSNGIEFFNDTDTTNLTCSVKRNGAVVSNVTFNWIGVNSDNTTIAVPNSGLIQIKDINSYAIFTCGAYLNGTYLGSSSIRILHTKLDALRQYQLIIKNGNRVFTYNEYGESPTHPSLKNPLKLEPLSFELLDLSGKSVSNLTSENILWKVPKRDTLVNVASPADEDDDYYYFNTTELSYTLAYWYNYNSTDNNIELVVNYNGTEVRATTSFTIVKLGDSNVNTKGYSCKIVTKYDYAILYYPDGVTYLYKFIKSTGRYSGATTISLTDSLENPFVEVYNGEEKLSSDSYSVKWEVLKDNPLDRAMIAINNDGVICKIPETAIDAKAYSSTIKCTVKILGNNTILTDYYSIPRVYVKDGYPFSGTNANPFNKYLPLKGGFDRVVYDYDGKLPRYANNSPFEISGVILEDDEYTWSIEKADGTTSQNLKIAIRGTDSSRQAWVEPASEYKELSVTDTVVAESNRFKIFFPVYCSIMKNIFSELEGWDGSSIELNKDDGYIVAPRVGAGKVDENGFTGVFMGETRTYNGDRRLNGIQAYHQGEKTVLIDAETGKVELGKGSEIVFDPENEIAKIAGFNIGEAYLEGHNVGIGSQIGENEYAFWAGSNTPSKAPFRVGFDGSFKIGQSNIDDEVQSDIIVSTITEYGVSSSKNVIPGQWTENMPSLSTNQYLWERTGTKKMNQLEYTYTEPKLMDSINTININKARVFYSSVEPENNQENSLSIGDLWINNTGNKNAVMKTWNGSAWVESLKYTDDTAVNNLQIGGRNILIGTNDGDSNWRWNTSGGVFSKGLIDVLSVDAGNFVCTEISPGRCVLEYSNINTSLLESNKKYTISFDILPTVDCAVSVSYKKSDGTQECINWGSLNCEEGVWRKFSKTATFNSVNPKQGQVIYITGLNNVGSYTIANLKLEYGDKSTDWTAAPEDIDAEFDKKVETWYGDWLPTLETEPYVSWIDNNENIKSHYGDLFFSTYDSEDANAPNGGVYRFVKNETGDRWEIIVDPRISNILSQVVKSQVEIDKKRQIFYNNPNDPDENKRLPKTPYEVGDLWVQGDNGDILRCVNGKMENAKAEISDWVKSSKYTDDTKINQLNIDNNNLYVISTALNGYINSSGSFVASDEYKTSDFIKTGDRGHFIMQFFENNERIGYYFAYYNENKEFIKVTETKYSISDNDIFINNDVSVSYVKLIHTISNISKAKFQIEIGTKPSLSYYPSYLDVYEEFKNVNSIFENLIVTEAGSLITKTENGYQFNLQPYINEIVSNDKKIGNLSDKLIGPDGESGELGSINDRIAEVVKNTGYINFEQDTSKGGPYIELGSKIEGFTSDFRLRISNDIMSFMYGGKRLAYFGFNTLRVEKVVVEDELYILHASTGNGYMWATHGNGNLGLSWYNGGNN